MAYTVGEVAGFAGVTVRTLHHYDQIGLLQPSGRSYSGYRLYDDGDLARLQQILFYRQLGFELAAIGEMLADPDWDEVTALRAQRALLEERAGHLHRLIDAVDRALEAHKMGIDLTPEERFEVFGDFEPDTHADEAAQRWGDTDLYEESARRTKRYGKEQWLAIKAEGDEAGRRLAACLTDGVPASDPRAVEAVDLHRQQIDRWFYPCSREMHVNLLDMQVGDKRFAAWWDAYAEGLLEYALAAARTGLERDGDT